MLIRTFFGVLFVLTAVFSSLSAQASSVAEDFEKLKNHPQDYRVFGTICEEVARLRLEEKLGKEEYDFTIGIAYHGKGKTLGELDISIFRKGDQEAIIVAEVKCWNNLRKAAQKANKQLKRFKTNLKANKIDSMHSTRDHSPYYPDQFDEKPQFMKLSQIGGKKAGFDMNIGLDLEEVKELRNKLILCQQQGQCPRSAADQNN